MNGIHGKEGPNKRQHVKQKWHISCLLSSHYMNRARQDSNETGLTQNDLLPEIASQPQSPVIVGLRPPLWKFNKPPLKEGKPVACCGAGEDGIPPVEDEGGRAVTEARE
ncbi:hypothetical protein SAY87_001469 [Trapa incisa]|uniref:Uncharacterized protein n=1 Tax=Trapa incisa TaxID=236973 RepID=A0AAN7JHW2_9MYRT|nr:hypothetical protein SAY87_001469 [Trapa incisa]